MRRFAATTAELPGTPPPEVQQQINVAWARSQVLFASDFDLRFEIDARRGRAWAVLRTPDGEVAGTLSASEALALACGDGAAALVV